MATPKTPRKAATNPKLDKRVETPDATPVEKLIEAGDAKEAVAEAPPPEAASVEDAEVMDPPKPTPESTPEPDHANDETFDSETSVPSGAPAVIKSGPGFLPLVLGGVIAAGIGFGLARYVVPEGWPLPGKSPLQTQLTQHADEIAALHAQFQALPQDSSQAVMNELAALRATANTALEKAEAAKLATMPATDQDSAARIAALEDGLAALESRPAGTDVVDLAALTGLSAELDSLRSDLAAQKTATKSLISEAETMRADAAAKAQSVLLQAALTKIKAAMLGGTPFVEPLTLLVDAGLPVPAILRENAENGVPTQAALIQGFEDPARAALAQSLRGNMGSTWTDRMGSFLRSQTGARSLTPQEGDDPDAVLSRANAAVVSGDLPTALTEITTLPDPAQTALAGWVAQVNLRIDAQVATAALATALSER
ncbi:COG4223 family protein [Pseudorhodobacter ferrugineus]|uniref:COG4223 family protein n=1 Tax=Pseudorhodobacter ferrugineus TaxID=77008 RepID=UPI0003B3E900|nr:hypothetical protein [Pseudorhodobacter ferrugineus]